MPNQFTVSTDKKEKIKLESGIVEASWVSPVAYGGFEAKFTVKTVFVAEGSTIEVKGKSSNGKAPDTVKGRVFNNSFKGSLLIPEKVAPGADIWFEAKLPKHGLKMESNVIPARPAMSVKKLCWDRKEVARHDIVTLTCQFEYGVLDGEEALFSIYEHNPDSCGSKLVTIRAVVKGSKAEIAWEFDYTGDTANIPTDAEKKVRGKRYINPHYYFVVSVNGQQAGVDRESGVLAFRDTATITVQHGNDSKNEDLSYTITFADGSTVSTKTDENHQITIDKVPPGTFTILPEGWAKRDTVTGKTGTVLIAIFPDTSLVIDAHMHIQSNNCCPIPLQWALVAESIAGFIKGRPSGDDRKVLNKSAAVDIENLGDLLAAPVVAYNLRRLGKIGRLSTDMISKLYFEKLNDNDMRHELCWTVLNESEMEKYTTNQKEMRIIAGRKAQLSTLTAKSSEQYDEQFVEKTRYYFEGNRICRMGIALLMDLSFGSYWGRSGLPIYLSCESGMLYINDFASIIITQCKDSDVVFVRFDESVVTPEIAISPEYGNVRPSEIFRSRIHLFPSFASRECAAFGVSSSLYTEQFELFTHANGTTKAPPLIRFEGTTVKAMLSRKYVHFVDRAPGEDAARFEDYGVQRERSIAASIMKPLSLFTFYHYDPRRHCLSSTLNVETVAKNILAEHAFFTVKQNNTYTAAHNNLRFNGCVDATAHEMLNDPASLSELLTEQLRTNEDAFAELHLHDLEGPGMFWGVKMYPRLGYSPSDFIHYPNLNSFYAACAAKGIPITTHCGPGGMSVPDYFLYERYDERRYLDHRDKDGSYSLKHAAQRFDGVVPQTTGKDSPARWEEVLQKFPKLKLNLAHFGGSDAWKESSGFSNMDKDLSNDKDTGKKYKKHHLYRDWAKKISELVDSHENVYTDISYFVNNDPLWFFGLGHDRDDVAEDLVYLLKKYGSLKDRLLMGSDWYMIEKEGEMGIGDYLRKMFYMLRTVSKEVGYDAWHQFSVVNPLRFLGLIDEKKGGAGPFTVDTMKLEALKKKFEVRLGDEEWKKENGCTITDNDFQKSFAEMLALFNNITISSGDNILRNNQLAILQPAKKGE